MGQRDDVLPQLEAIAVRMFRAALRAIDENNGAFKCEIDSSSIGGKRVLIVGVAHGRVEDGSCVAILNPDEAVMGIFRPGTYYMNPKPMVAGHCDAMLQLWIDDYTENGRSTKLSVTRQSSYVARPTDAGKPPQARRQRLPLTSDAIADAKKRTKYSLSEHHHEHDDCIRFAYEWLDAQVKTAGTLKKTYALKHIIENWAGRYVSTSDVEVAAELHPDIHGVYPHFNISSRLTQPSVARLAGLGETEKHRNTYTRDMGETYAREEAS